MPASDLPQAVLWDMDGTLIDSEPISITQQFEIVAEHHADWSLEQSLALVGTDMFRTADALRAAGVDLPRDELARMLDQGVLNALRESVTWRPGAVELLADLRHHGVPNAIVTTSAHVKTDLVIGRLPAGTFGAVICAEDVEHAKPHPDPYQRAARELGVDIRRCIAIEDSPTGLRSAVSAGAVCIAVPNNARIPDQGAWSRWSTLQDRATADVAWVLKHHDEGG